MELRDHTFLGMTQSLCPECLTVVPAKILVKAGGRVYFRKRCPTHGVREDFVCSDVRQFDRMEFSLPGKVPPQFGVDPDKGCPLDCGLCTEHEQHTCVGLVEITANCNLTCPLCYAQSAPGGRHLSLADCRRAIDRLVEVEGRPEVLQLSGGEPTIHPQFFEVLEYAVRQPIDIVMINTNGIRIAHDPEFVAHLAEHRGRLEIYLQFDGLEDRVYERLRGEALADIKLRAVEALGRHGLRVILVATVEAGVNDDQLGPIVGFGLARSWVTGVSFQPATYCGRHELPEVLERRVTFPDVIRRLAEQTDGLFHEHDFLPLPCAHPNCHSLSYAYRSSGRVVPLLRFIDAEKHLDLLANGITFTRPRARQLIEQYLGRQGCCAGGDCSGDSAGGAPALVELTPIRPAPLGQEPLGELPPKQAPPGLTPVELNGHSDAAQRTRPASGGEFGEIAEEFFARALAEQLAPEDVFRITITSFLDAYNFDVRRLMKCCIHHVLPSGHVIPFCAYNVLYRDGHVPLPPLTRRVAVGAAAERLAAESDAEPL
jgi:7,8-dihydro-6-hydroxymethylpterin dimethyltransferase